MVPIPNSLNRPLHVLKSWIYLPYFNNTNISLKPLDLALFIPDAECSLKQLHGVKQQAKQGTGVLVAPMLRNAQPVKRGFTS